MADSDEALDLAIISLGAWALAVPPVAGLLFSFWAVWTLERVRGPNNRLPDSLKAVLAITTAALGCFSVWGLLYGWDLTALVVSAIVGVSSPGVWYLILRVLRSKFPRAYAKAKVKNIEYTDAVSKDAQDEDETTVWFADTRTRRESWGGADRRE